MLKKHLIHLTYKSHSLALPTLNVLRTKYPKFTGNMEHCGVSVVYPHDHMPDWYLGLAATASTMRECCTTHWQPGERSSSRFDVQCLLNAYCFFTILKYRNSKSKDHQSGIICRQNLLLEYKLLCYILEI